MKVSVIIPAYNSEKFINDAIQSVHSQTMKPHEILVVDDGSTDKTIEIATKAGVTSVVTHNHSGSIGYMRKWGASMATGDFIAFLSADDIWYKSFLMKMTKEWLQGTIVYSNYFKCNEKLEKFLEFKSPEPSVNNIIEYAKKPDMFINFSSILIPREVFDEVQFDENAKVGEDLIFVLECLLNNWTFINVNNSLSYYRIHPKQGKIENEGKEYLVNKVNDLIYQINTAFAGKENGGLLI